MFLLFLLNNLFYRHLFSVLILALYPSLLPSLHKYVKEFEIFLNSEILEKKQMYWYPEKSIR